MILFNKKWMSRVHTIALVSIIWGFLFKVTPLLVIGLLVVILIEGYDFSITDKLPTFLPFIFYSFYFIALLALFFYVFSSFTHAYSLQLSLILWLLAALGHFVVKAIYKS